MTKRKLWVFLAVFAVLFGVMFTACGDDNATTTAGEGATTTAASEGFTIGVSWNNYQEERWANWDEPAIVAAIEDAGGTYISSDAGSSEEQQITDVERLIADGADALIILAQDQTAILPAVESALNQGIPVVAYDRLIENPGALYITFDNVEVGRMQARAVYAVQPTGNYVMIKGNPADANADFLREGQGEVLADAIAAGDITIVAEEYTDNWDPAIAQTNMEQILTQQNNEVDAVVASNDGTAGGVIAALTAQGMAGLVPVSGQDGDAAALNRVALGTQTVSVWKDARDLGKAAGEAAVAMAQGTALEDVAGTVLFDSPGGNSMVSILLAPVPITQDNLQLVLDADWIDVDTLCQGVPAGTVDVCD